MARPVLLFSGPWTDLPLAELAAAPPIGATRGSNWPAGVTTSKVQRALSET